MCLHPKPGTEAIHLAHANHPPFRLPPLWVLLCRSSVEAHLVAAEGVAWLQLDDRILVSFGRLFLEILSDLLGAGVASVRGL